MSLDLNFALILGVFIICAVALLGAWEKVLSIRKLSQRQPPLDQELKTLLSDMEKSSKTNMQDLEARITSSVKAMIPDMKSVEERLNREIDRAEQRSRTELTDFRTRYENVIPQIFDLLRKAEATASRTHTDVIAMVARMEAALDMHLKADDQKGKKA